MQKVSLKTRNKKLKELEDKQERKSYWDWGDEDEQWESDSEEEGLKFQTMESLAENKHKETGHNLSKQSGWMENKKQPTTTTAYKE